MSISSDELKVARSWIGETEPDATFQERYDRLGSLDAAIAESLRAQLAVLELDTPAQFTVDNISMSFGSNMQEIRKTLEEFLALGGTTGEFLPPGAEGIAGEVARLTRPSTR